jgi:Family of unknown function (DUF5961)
LALQRLAPIVDPTRAGADLRGVGILFALPRVELREEPIVGAVNMTDLAIGARRFSVRARHLDAHHARLLSEATFEAAAIAYVEDLLAASPAEAELSVIVRDVVSGHEHCFRLDLATGGTAPCV